MIATFKKLVRGLAVVAASCSALLLKSWQPMAFAFVAWMGIAGVAHAQSIDLAGARFGIFDDDMHVTEDGALVEIAPYDSEDASVDPTAQGALDIVDLDAMNFHDSEAALAAGTTDEIKYPRVATHGDVSLVVWREGNRIRGRLINSNSPQSVLDISNNSLDSATDLPPGQRYNELSVAAAILDDKTPVFHVLWSEMSPASGKRFVYRRTMRTDGSFLTDYPFMVFDTVTDLYQGTFQPEIACFTGPHEIQGVLGLLRVETKSTCLAAFRTRCGDSSGEAYQLSIYRISDKFSTLVATFLTDEDNNRHNTIQHYHKLAIASGTAAMLVYSEEVDPGTSLAKTKTYARSINPKTRALGPRHELIDDTPTWHRFDLAATSGQPCYIRTIFDPPCAAFVPHYAFVGEPYGGTDWNAWRQYINDDGSMDGYMWYLSTSPGTIYRDTLVTVSPLSSGTGALATWLRHQKPPALPPFVAPHVRTRTLPDGSDVVVPDSNSFVPSFPLGSISEYAADSAPGIATWICPTTYSSRSICALLNDSTIVEVW